MINEKCDLIEARIHDDLSIVIVRIHYLYGKETIKWTPPCVVLLSGYKLEDKNIRSMKFRLWKIILAGDSSPRIPVKLFVNGEYDSQTFLDEISDEKSMIEVTRVFEVQMSPTLLCYLPMSRLAEIK